ncbi:PAS domain-containing sensor histidine kinase [Pinisolibacter aquiterrae]|uniref:PAS domain-containing sensor histidine kinase n=1 Tax=Pinisolibacter aquiterrae TaxID=2815579 RepID=UPI001C3CCDBB|nr:PAS domain-containing sensor histidine kinase [Pinisolibacter aquiterrae]MBV5263464.1 PAS domain-containing sensor histidine kinase [Pinisolibacter aquiterrae]MCC8237459.1 PAS domain-containing sensor histidine kinase [Pinisolibacter aquiterrae]
MVDGFAEVWPVVALEGVGALIGDARPGFVAVDAGRRLAFANAAAGAILPGAVWGAALALDPRLAERLARFADRAAPAEEARELLRLAEHGRPVLRTVVFRRPIDDDDAVIVTIDGVRADPSTAGIEASLAPFVATGGLAALFDADGGVLGALGDHTLVDGREAEIETILAEADEIAVIERRLDGAARPLDLALVRFGDRPDARRLLWISPVATAEPAPLESRPVAPSPAEPARLAEPAPAPAAAIADVASEDETTSAALPLLAAALAPEAPAAEAAEIPPAAPVTAPTEIEAPAELADDDLFVAAPPLPLDLFSDFDDGETELADAWSATVAPPAVTSIEAETGTLSAEAVTTPDVTDEPPAANLEAEVPAPLPLETPIAVTPAASTVLPRIEERETDEADLAPSFDAAPLPLAAAAMPLPLAAQPIEAEHDAAPVAPVNFALPLPETAREAATEAAEIEPEVGETEPEAVEVEAEPAAPVTDVAAPSETTPAAATALPPEPAPAPGRRFQFTPPERAVKFVWQMDADHRFTLVSEEFAAVVGPAAADLVGRRWSEVAEDFDLDRDGTIAGALARRDTWSGRTLPWPIEGEALRILVDLAALPAFARGRTFSGFRGFGTCRTDAPLPDPTGIGLRLAARAPDEPVAVTDEPLVPVAPTSEAAPTPDVEPTVACVVETLAEPPLYPGDGESATSEVDHPIEPAFAGDIGDDPIFHPEAEIAPAEAEPETAPAATEDATPDLGATTAPVVGLASLPVDDVPAEPIAAEPAALAASEPAPAAPSEPAPAAAPTTPAEPAPPRAEARSSARVVALSGVARVATDADHLSGPERLAFRQIAEALGARIEGETEAPAPLAAPARPLPAAGPLATQPRGPAPVLDARLLDRLPVAVALLRDDTLIHANERFLSLLRYPDLDALRAAGGVDALFAGSHVARRFETAAGRITPLIAQDGTVVPCEARLATVPVEGGSAAMLTLIERPAAAAAEQDRERIAELQAIVDTATDGVLILDASGLVLSANTAAEVLFGVERRAMVGRPLTERLAPESRRSAIDYLDGLAANGVASVLNDGREVIGAVAPEGLIPLFMTIGRVSSGPVAKYCAVLRDITQWKKSEEELTSARRRAEEASIHKSDFLAKISHEIRTPLNAIIGFSELMLDERFGPVGNERYKDYLRDIHVSGSHIMSLVNDLLDLSKVEAGKMDLRFEAVPLADVVSECVAMMQPQANRERIIIRSSLPAGVPPVVADSRSMRQVVLNLLSNAIKFTPAGGQVIVSITAEDNGEVILRVRDTGYGMSDKELQTALEPFRQLHTTRSRAGGTGLGLPLTKALTEANRAVFRIDSTVGQGTLVSIAFPVTRVLAG